MKKMLVVLGIPTMQIIESVHMIQFKIVNFCYVHLF